MAFKYYTEKVSIFLSNQPTNLLNSLICGDLGIFVASKNKKQMVNVKVIMNLLGHLTMCCL